MNTLNMLDRMNGIDPEAWDWMLVGAGENELLSIDDARPQMTRLVESGVGQAEDEPPDPRWGYNVHAVTRNTLDPRCSTKVARIGVGAGSVWDNSVSFSVGEVMGAFDPTLVTYANYRATLDILVSIWPCPWACAYANPKSPPVVSATQADFDRLAELRPTGAPSLPWFLYLSAPLAFGLTPPPQVDQERTPGGGMILSAVKERLDPNNLEHLRRSRMLDEIINKRIWVDPPHFKWGARSGPY